MNFRTKPRIKQTIQRAAALVGVDDFGLHHERGLQVRAGNHRGARAHAGCSLPTMRASSPRSILGSPCPTAKLHDAFARHGRTIESK